jgi:hypothetical protein
LLLVGYQVIEINEPAAVDSLDYWGINYYSRWMDESPKHQQQ